MMQKTNRLLIAIVAVMIMAQHAEAQSFKVGFDFYSRGNFSSAEKAFVSARGKDRLEQANIQKFLGISQYMQKKLPQARESFRRALQSNPKTNITPSEVLDESVIAFFNQQRLAAPTTVAKRAVNKPQPVLKTTYLKINSNISNASIQIEGILAGRTGSLLEVKPGVVEVQLNAPGYVSKKAKIQIVANRENSVQIILEKIRRKTAKPVAVAKKKLPDPEVDSLFDEGRSSAMDPSLSARDLQSEFALDAGSAGSVAPSPGYIQPGYPPPAAYPSQPYGAYPSPAYPPQQYPPAYAPAYPPAYAPQPYAPQPYSYPSPYQYSPYAPALPPPSIAPVGPPPPLPVPAEGAYNNNDYQDANNEAFLPKTKSKKSKKSNFVRRTMRTKKTPQRPSSSGNSILITILPFGAGQFQNGSFFLGSMFAGAELGALGWYVKNKMDADQAITDAETFYASDATDEQKNTYSEDVEPYVKDKRKQQNIGLYSFAGLYVLGVAEALINEPAPPKRKKRSRVGLLDDPSSISNEERLAIAESSRDESDPVTTSSLLHIKTGVIPELMNVNDSNVVVGIAAAWTF